MAANTDKLMEVGNPGTATTLAAPGYTTGGTSITVVSTTNWPTATGVCFAMDEAEIVDGVEVQVAGSYNEYFGTVASGTSVTNVTHVTGSGTDRNYSAGALSRVYVPVSAGRENRIVEWGLEEHNQDGTHGTMTADNLTVDGTLTQTGVASFTTHIDVNDSSTAIRDSSDNELVKFSKTASAVNELTIANAATANGPELQATGGDTNIDIELITKGTGIVKSNGEQVHVGTPATSSVSTSQTTTSTSYTDLATSGPAVTVTIGNSGMALVCLRTQVKINTAAFALMGYAVSGASTVAASDSKAVGNVNTSEIVVSSVVLETGLTPGSNTFTSKYRVSANTGTFQNRSITVIPL